MSAASTEQKQYAGAFPSQTINEVFHESMRGCEKALKSAVELQEQSIGMWSELLTHAATPERFQKKMETFNADLFPAFRKQMEENVGAFNLVSSEAVALIRKSTELLQATSIPDAQRRLQDYLESLMRASRINVHLALNSAARMMNLWSESAMQANRASK